MGVQAVLDVSSSANWRITQTTGGVRRRRRLTRRPASGRALLLQDRDSAPSGLLVDALRTRPFETEVVNIDRAGRLPDPESVDLAILVGTARVSGSDAPAWLEPQVDWLRRADQAGTAVLALGSAAQALAIALGGGVERLPGARRSWVRVTPTSLGAISAGPWLAWEDDRILLPPDAELLAEDHVGPQAFAVKEHLGVQLHPEATPGIVADWVLNSDEVLDFEGTVEAAWRDYPVASVAARPLFADFVDSVAQDRH